MVEIEIGPYLVSYGSFVLSWHGFFSFIAVASAVYLVGRWAPMRGVSADDVYSIAVWAIIGGVVGARLVHVVDHWGEFYQHDPTQIIAVWNGGIGLWGGILGGFVGGVAYAARARHPIGVIADITAPALLLAQTIGRLGDIVNGEHCAKATDLIFGFNWTNPASNAAPCANGVGVPVQPVIAYEMVWNMLALFIVWRLRGRLKPDGMLFALYLAFYAVGRFAITFAREDRIWGAALQEAHLIALIVLAITIPLLAWKARFAPGEPEWQAAPVQPRGTRAQRRRRTRGR